MLKLIVSTAVMGLFSMAANAQQNSEPGNGMKQNNNTFINPPGLFDASKNGFSHVGLKSGKSEFVFIAGQWASDLTGDLAIEEFGGQVKQTVINLKKALSSVGLTERDIIKLTIYIANYTPEKKLILLQAASPLLEMEIFPTSIIVPVPVMATHPKSLIEIEAIATK